MDTVLHSHGLIRLDHQEIKISWKGNLAQILVLSVKNSKKCDKTNTSNKIKKQMANITCKVQNTIRKHRFGVKTSYRALYILSSE